MDTAFNAAGQPAVAAALPPTATLGPNSNGLLSRMDRLFGPEPGRAVERADGWPAQAGDAAGDAAGEYLARAAAALVIAIGLLVLIGWRFDLIFFKSFHESLVSMKPNTAIGFICAGLACLLAGLERGEGRLRPWRDAAALVALILGSLVACQWLFALDLRIDELLFPDDRAGVGTFHPGRMTMWTAASFVLFGAALLLIDAKNAFGRGLSQMLASSACLPSVLSLVGYALGAEELYGAGLKSHMALHTAAAFVLLTAGILAARPERVSLMSLIRHYGVPALAVALGFLARWLLSPVMADENPFVLHWPAIFVAAWVGGFQGGVMATWFSTLGISLFVLEPHGSLVIARLSDQIGAGLFLGMGVGFSLLVATVRQLERDRLAADAEARAGRAASAYHRSLIESSVDPLVAIGADGRITDVNAATSRMLGRGRQELIGTDFADCFTQPDKARETHQQAFRDGLLRDCSLEIRDAAGRNIPVLYNVSVYRDEAGGAAGVFAAARDITHLRKAEEALRKSEERFALAVKGAKDGIWDWDLVTNEVYFSPGWKAMLGYQDDELPSRYEEWETRLHPDDRASTLQAVRDYLGGRTPLFEVEFRLRHKDDAYRWVLGRGAALRDASGKPYRMSGSHTDIQERTQKDAELRKIAWLLSERPGSPEGRVDCQQPYGDLVQLNTAHLIADGAGAQTLHSLVHNTMDLLETSAAVYEQNGDYALGIFSSGWCRKLDEASRKLCGTDDNREALASGKWTCHESCWECSRKSIETGRPVDAECQGGIRLYAVPVRRGDEIVGSMNFSYGDPPRDPQKLAELAEKYHLSVDELRTAAGQYESRPAYLVNLAKERLKTSAALVGAILEAKQARAETEHLNCHLEARVTERTLQLEAANQELEAFAYSVSHDLRAPLRGVDGFSQALLEDYEAVLNEQGKNYLHRIRNASQHMAGLIDDLLHLSRTTRADFERRPMNLSEMARAQIAALRARAPDRHVEAVIADNLTLEADPRLMQVVLDNLIGNAWEFTSKRENARIEVGCRCGPDGKCVYFVKDNGAGFDMRYADKLFGAFQRLHTADQFPGNGIGLATVRRIVNKHGGRIWAEAALDHGAVFYFTL